jgi:peptide/nickel transport system permease protein
MGNVAVTAPELVEEPKRRSLLANVFVRLVREKPLGTVGAAIVLLIALTAILANFIAPYGVNELHMIDRLSSPSAKYLLGTDNLGRDMLTRIIYGARISLTVGFGAAFISVVGATVIGTLCGFIGGKFDLTVQRFVDAWLSFPGLVIYLSVMSLAGSGLVQVTLTLGIAWGIGGSRIVRSAVIGIKENMYMQAAEAVGSPRLRTIVRHVLPNIAAPIIVLFTLNTGGAILTEATLSFLGFGVPPPQPTWGGMLSAEGRNYMLQAPWMALWPGVALSLTVYGINVLGDALRDILDPRLRGGIGRYGRMVSGKSKVAR